MTAVFPDGMPPIPVTRCVSPDVERLCRAVVRWVSAAREGPPGHRDPGRGPAMTVLDAVSIPGLTYVEDTAPGFRRRRCGRGFTYLDEHGRRIRDPETIDRLRRLAVPPAWTDVWLCARPDGHIQA